MNNIRKYRSLNQKYCAIVEDFFTVEDFSIVEIIVEMIRIQWKHSANVEDWNTLCYYGGPFIIAEILVKELLVLINIHLWKTLFNLKMFFKMLAKIAPLGGYAEF